jgi:phage baseplate assembly protein gpV
LGTATSFSARALSGSNVVYNWDFGDGHSATGDRLSHVYKVSGVYQVVVTAANGVSECVAWAQIHVRDPRTVVFLPFVLKYD